MAEARLLFINDAGIVSISTLDGIDNVSEIGMIKKTSVTLTNAQIKSLPTTSIEMVAAVPGSIHLPWFGTISTHIESIYTNISATHAINIWNGSSGSLELSPVLNYSGSFAGVTAILGFTGDLAVMIPPAANFSTDWGSIVPLIDGFNLSANLNTSIILASDNSGAYTGGNANNTLTATLWYTTLAI